VASANTYVVTAGDQTNGYAVIDAIKGQCRVTNLAVRYPSNVVSIDAIIRRFSDSPLVNGIPVFQQITPPSNLDWIQWTGSEEIPNSQELTLIIYPVYTGDLIQIREGHDE
jgi:hypothetical protein